MTERATPAEATAFAVERRGERWTAVTIIDTTLRQSAEHRAADISRSYRALAHTNHVALNARTEQELFDEMCEIVVDVGGYLHAFIGVVSMDGRVDVVASYGSFGEFAHQLDLTVDAQHPKGNGPVARALREGVPQFERDFAGDPRTQAMRCLVDDFGVRASAALPLRCDDTTVAVLSLYSTDPNRFDTFVTEMLDSMAANVSVALGALDGQRRLREAAVARAELMERLITAREQERLRIAEDVHDHTLQGLAALDLRLTLLERLAKQGRADLATSAAQLRELAGAVTHDLRQLIYELRPTDVSHGLAGTLRGEAEFIFADTGVHWTVDAGPGTELRGLGCAQAVRIAKEALLNVRAHAAATQVRVTLERIGGGVAITVLDDGLGIDVRELVSPRGHCGIDTMRERAEVAGGWWRAEPEAAGGTAVRFWLPDAHAL